MSLLLLTQASLGVSHLPACMCDADVLPAMSPAIQSACAAFPRSAAALIGKLVGWFIHLFLCFALQPAVNDRVVRVMIMMMTYLFIDIIIFVMIISLSTALHFVVIIFHYLFYKMAFDFVCCCSAVNNNACCTYCLYDVYAVGAFK